MDKVRLGRVLGAGARQAARTAWEAVDAATAPSPKTNQQPRSTQPPRPAFNASEALATAAHTVQTVQSSKQAAKKAAFAPIRRASRILWLEITGSFFLFFAIGFAINAGRLYRSGWATHRNVFIFSCAVSVLFLYFGVTSFLSTRKK